MSFSTGINDQAEAGFSLSPPPPLNVCSPYFSSIDTGYACILQSSPKSQAETLVYPSFICLWYWRHGARKGRGVKGMG
jgi:hypothetical protein